MIRLRKKDQLMGIVDSLNLMTGSLREKLIMVQNDLEQLRNTASGQGASGELLDGLDALDRKIRANFKI